MILIATKGSLESQNLCYLLYSHMFYALLLSLPPAVLPIFEIPVFPGRVP